MRLSWDEYFFEVAKAAALRGTCPRKKVGAIIVDSNRKILATGYNGSIPGDPHCEDVGCLVVDNSCKRTVHAEANALVQFDVGGYVLRLTPYTIYCTMEPCSGCMKLIGEAQKTGVTFEIKWLEPYHPKEEDGQGT
jgi:dCMP deaminase